MLKNWQMIQGTPEKNLFPYPVLLKKTIAVYHNLDLVPAVKPPYLVIIDLLHVTEPVTRKILLHEFEELNFLCKKRIFILLCLAGKIETLVCRNYSRKFPVLVKPGELPPVNVPVFVRFAVEHIRVNAADCKTTVVNATPAIIQKPAGSSLIVLCP